MAFLPLSEVATGICENVDDARRVLALADAIAASQGDAR